MAVVLLAVSPLVAACTPGEIEQSIQMLNFSFEEGGLEGGLSSAALHCQRETYGYEVGVNQVRICAMTSGS